MPDPIPFDKKLKSMLEDHADFIRTKEEEMVGNAVLEEVHPAMLLPRTFDCPRLRQTLRTLQHAESNVQPASKDL